jgi:predicted ATPase
MLADPFLRRVRLDRASVDGWDEYPFSIPAVATLDEVELHPAITFLAGENGSGKSTLIEAIAIAAGYNPEGGPRDLQLATRATESVLGQHLIPSWRQRPDDGFFLRAETFFNVATALEDASFAYGGRSLHEQSHGESFLALVLNRFGRKGRQGLYLLDEPEAAFSFQGALRLLASLHDLVASGSQFVIATHSPVLLAYPDAAIYQLNEAGIAPSAYQDTEAYQLTRAFLEEPSRFLRYLLSDEPD